MFGSTHTSISFLFPQDDKGLCFFSSTEELIEKARQVIQFKRGVFIAFPINKDVFWDLMLLPQTEAPIGLQHPESEIEIRTFDYSYFEIYGPRVTLINILGHFNR